MIIVYWAQRSNLVYLTIDLQDTEKPEINLDKDGLVFKANADKKEWEFSLPFFAAVDVEVCVLTGASMLFHSCGYFVV
jgi:prostaglandin-E synthase